MIEQLRTIVGADYVFTGLDAAPYETEWRQRVTGKSLCVVKPANATQVAAVVKLCAQSKTPIVPQGGNTGLVLGSIPDDRGAEVVLSLTRLNQVLNIDTANDTMTVQAGCILQAVQDAAAQEERLFPLSLAAEGSCTIGGNLSTNAGGTQVLRWGNTRDLCLGIEWVNAQGEVISQLSGLRKDNTGYDLKNLLIGAEGTLGIVTAATFKLFPLPVASRTAWVQLSSVGNAIELLKTARAVSPGGLTGFELISDICLQLVKQEHGPACPIPAPSPWSVLLELSDWESEAHCNAVFEQLLETAFEQGLITDAAVAQNQSQSAQMWAIREFIPEAQQKAGKNIKHDISVPISAMQAFLDETDAALNAQFAGVQLVTFGHLGDSNLHYNVAPPAGYPAAQFDELSQAVNVLVYQNVINYGGSISAEHGIGRLKKAYMPKIKSAPQLAAMRSIKAALDPEHIFNPGVIF